MPTPSTSTDYQARIIRDTDTLRAIQQALMDTYFQDCDPEHFTTAQGKTDLEANVAARYNKALTHIVPWVANTTPLGTKRLVEIGCGTGSSTAAFSHFVEKVDGYDIDAGSIEAARARFSIMNISNADVHLVSAEDCISTVQKNHPDGIDILLLYAVLEHQTIAERHETITGCWNLLNDDGLLIIADTPNLLCYHDHHTSLLPFLHLLPADLYAQYARFSPRKNFGCGFDGYQDLSTRTLELAITRLGRGISYHDFDLALGKDYKNHLICNGFEKEILDSVQVTFEEELLRSFIERHTLDIPAAFSRVVLNFILKKGDPPPHPLPPPPANSFFVPMDQYKACEERNHQLQTTLAQMRHSKRWKLGSLLAAPYRALKRYGR